MADDYPLPIDLGIWDSTITDQDTASTDTAIWSAISDSANKLFGALFYYFLPELTCIVVLAVLGGILGFYITKAIYPDRRLAPSAAADEQLDGAGRDALAQGEHEPHPIPMIACILGGLIAHMVLMVLAGLGSLGRWASEMTFSMQAAIAALAVGCLGVAVWVLTAIVVLIKRRLAKGRKEAGTEMQPLAQDSS